MVLDKPKLLIQTEIRRSRFFRRFLWMLLGTVAAAAAWIALDYAAGEKSELNRDLLRAGQIAAVFVFILLAFRALIHLVRWLTVPSEAARFFDRGFVWKRGKKEHKYNWTQLKAFREGARSIRIFRRPILETGAQVLVMKDGNVFKFTARHGDTRRFADQLRPIIADVTGTAMGRALRQDKAIQLHKHLIVRPAGIVAGKHKIRWSELDVQMRRGQLLVCRLNKKGRFKTVRSFDMRQIDNLAGFLDIAHSTIQNHQPARFNIKAYGVQ